MNNSITSTTPFSLLLHYLYNIPGPVLQYPVFKIPFCRIRKLSHEREVSFFATLRSAKSWLIASFPLEVLAKISAPLTGQSQPVTGLQEYITGLLVFFLDVLLEYLLQARITSIVCVNKG